MCGFEGTYLFGPVAQLVRAPPCHGGGRGFDSHPGRFIFWIFGIIAQLGEHLPYKQRVIGSSPIGPISSENGFKCYANVTQFMTIEEWNESSVGRTADYKSAVMNTPMWLNWQSSWFVISRLTVRVRSSALLWLSKHFHNWIWVDSRVAKGDRL